MAHLNQYIVFRMSYVIQQQRQRATSTNCVNIPSSSFSSSSPSVFPKLCARRWFYFTIRLRLTIIPSVFVQRFSHLFICSQMFTKKSCRILLTTTSPFVAPSIPPSHPSHPAAAESGMNQPELSSFAFFCCCCSFFVRKSFSHSLTRSTLRWHLYRGIYLFFRLFVCLFRLSTPFLFMFKEAKTHILRTHTHTHTTQTPKRLFEVCYTRLLLMFSLHLSFRIGTHKRPARVCVCVCTFTIINLIAKHQIYVHVLSFIDMSTRVISISSYITFRGHTHPQHERQRVYDHVRWRYMRETNQFILLERAPMWERVCV